VLSRIARTFGILASIIAAPFAAQGQTNLDEAALREIGTVLCPGDKTLLSEVLLAARQPTEYLKKFNDELFERGIEDFKEVDYWLALIDGLARRKCLIDVDWKNSGEDLAWNLNQLQITSQKDLNWKLLDKMGSDYKTTPEFSDEIERVLKPKKLVAIFLIYSGDSYAISLTSESNVKKLQANAHKLKQRIEIFDKDAGNK
jgi:hypothetical protein